MSCRERLQQFVFNAGSHRETMTVAFTDFARLAGPQVAEFAAVPRAAAV